MKNLYIPLGIVTAYEIFTNVRLVSIILGIQSFEDTQITYDTIGNYYLAILPPSKQDMAIHTLFSASY